MPSDTFPSFGRRVDKFVNGISGAELRRVMTEVGVEAKKTALEAASADLGGDPKFSGWAPSLDTRFDHAGEGRIIFHPSKRSAGPWKVADVGRSPGSLHGATPAKGTASRAVAKIEAESPKRIEDAVKKALSKAFG